MLNVGDVVVGLKEANEPYSITIYNTQWIVYDTLYRTGERTQYILLGKPCPKDTYLENQKEYDRLKNLKDNDKYSIRARDRLRFKTHWVQEKYFKFVYALIMNHNEDGLRLLNQDEEDELKPLKGLII